MQSMEHASGSSEVHHIHIRSDHVYPSHTTKANVSTLANYDLLTSNSFIEKVIAGNITVDKNTKIATSANITTDTTNITAIQKSLGNHRLLTNNSFTS
jgi:hypothetical protein